MLLKQEQEHSALKVLLVDDDAFVHEMLALLIDRNAFAMSSARNVKEAMIAIANDPPDLIVTDAMMPGESGFHLIEWVKADPHTRDIPIILLTILQQPDGSVMDASGKADLTVTKPIYLSDITSVLEQAKQLLEYRKSTREQWAEPQPSFTIVL
ncbi:MAG TPA: response regulator [Blastocatellia bacterium]|nr:response regulator [Blastocatellia bacterium]